MNIYYLKKYRKKAKKIIRVIFTDNEYKVIKYNHHIRCDYPIRNLCVAKMTLAIERRKYILELVKNRREINKNKELAKL